MYTLLHISDLHRSPDDQVSNDELISSLISDREFYSDGSQPIGKPDAIIVSGDLIRGSPLGSLDYPSDLLAQYQVALEFLSQLAERFVDGDRSKVVIVPGNHDVDWNSSFGALDEVEEYPANLRELLFMQGTPYRWSWNDQKLFKVEHIDRYSQRFEYYWNLVSEYYSDVDFAYGFDPKRYYNLFELDEGRIAVAAFNSCNNNDCFSSIGEIPFEAVSQSHVSLLDSSARYELKVAVWHHSVEGPPRNANYMDADTVRLLIHKGFRLGLHGHQHRSDATPHSIHVAGDHRMAVVSAGSLCAGARELPVGVHRQYNLVEIHDNYARARIHVREMTLPNIYTAGRLASLGARSHVDIEWTEVPEDTIAGSISPSETRIRAVVLRAEEHFHRDRIDSALQLLLPISGELDAFGNQILRESLVKAERWPELQALAREPTDSEELTLLIRAHTAVGDFDLALKDLDHYAQIVDLPAPNRDDLRAFVLAQRELQA